MQRLTAQDAGCWVDNCRGIYMGERIIQIAREYGWDGEGTQASDLTVHGWEEDPDGDPEGHQWATDAAEEYLQGLCPEGYWVGYSDSFGDFGMWEVEETWECDKEEA